MFIERLRSRRPLNRLAREKLRIDIRNFAYTTTREQPVRKEGEYVVLHPNAAAIIKEHGKLEEREQQQQQRELQMGTRGGRGGRWRWQHL